MAKKISKVGVNLIKEFEGCYLKAYKDPVGVWTIGYGITNSDKSITGTSIYSGLEISQKTADEWLKNSLNKKYVPLVLKYDSKYNWSQNELDALTSFAYNIGSIDQLTANGTRSKKQISEKLLQYNKAGGRVLNGLTRRRKAEKAMFDGERSSSGVISRGQTNANTFVDEWLKNPVQITVDGVAGPKTRAQCIRCLQIAINKDYNRKLVVDGVAGSKFKKAIKDKTIKRGDEKYLVLAVKIMYQCFGLDSNLKYSNTFGNGLYKTSKKSRITGDDMLLLLDKIG